MKVFIAYLGGLHLGRYIGPTSLQSLILDVQEFVLQPLCDQPRSQPLVVSARESLNELLEFRVEIDSISDHSPPATPPLAMLEAMMEAYFHLVSPRLPIWSYESLQRLIKSSKTSGDANKNRICAVSCNNMILLTLTSKFLRSESTRLVHSAEKQRSSSMELELIKPFVINAKRAVNKIEQFLSPSLANVQASLSLCLVAQQYLTDDIFSLTYHQAVYLARFIGLDYSQLSAGNPKPEHIRERRNVLDCLCILGTSVSWITGFHSGFVTLETTAALASQDLNSDKEWRGRLKLTYLQDQVFSLLYSPHLRSKTVREIQYVVSSLKQELEHWWKEYGESVTVESADSISGAQIERAISYYSIKILLAWPISDGNEDSQGVLDDSRSCLKSFICAWEMEADLGHYACLARLLVSYPPVAFIKLLANYINNISSGSRAEDLKTLQAFVRIIEIASDLSEAKSYTTRLFVFTQIMTSFAAAYQSSPLREPATLQPEQLQTDPSIGNENSVGALISSAAEYSENSYSDLKAIDGFDLNVNSAFQFNMSDIGDDFFATSGAGF